MDDLVVRALRESGVDVAERLHPAGGKPGGEGHGVLLLDAYVEELLRMAGGQPVHPAALRHRGGDADDRGVLLRQFAEHFAEDVLVTVVGVRGVDAFAGLRIEMAGRVPGDGIRFRGSVAFPLEGEAVQQARSRELVQAAQRLDDFVDVIAVDRTEVAEAQRLEDVPPGFADNP